jgi:phospholipase/carboxylesterase
MTTELTGPRIAPRSRGPARQLVIFLHGYGADGNDLIELGRIWQTAMPDAQFPREERALGRGQQGRPDDQSFH